MCCRKRRFQISAALLFQYGVDDSNEVRIYHKGEFIHLGIKQVSLSCKIKNTCPKSKAFMILQILS